MIRHVVIWSLAGDTPSAKKTAFDALKPQLEALVGTVPGLESLEVNYSTGPNPKNWDMCLMSEHDSWQALDEYANHPAHLEVAALVTAHTTSRAAADFEV